MEYINTIFNAVNTLVTAIGVGAALAAFSIEVLHVSGTGLILYLFIYIGAILLFAQWIRRNIRK